jgi:hypothetical protein
LEYSIGGASLYRHRDLWHPNYFGINSNQDSTSEFAPESKLSVENPPDPPSIKTNSQLDCVRGASNWRSSTSLLPTNGGDNPAGKASSDHGVANRDSVDGNFSAKSSGDDSASDSLQGVEYVQQVLFNIKAQQEAFQEAARIAQTQHQRIRSEAAERRQVSRMQQFLASGDPILVAEAMAWAQVNPGVLNVEQLQIPLSQDF